MKQYSIFILLSALISWCNSAPVFESSLEEEGGFFEGDLNLTPGQIRDIFVNRNAGLLNTNFRWNHDSSGFVSVPYSIRSGSPYSEY